MKPADLKILHEDNHLLVISKPAGIATMGIAEQSDSLLGVAKQYIGEKYDKPGNVYLGVVSRLDSRVSGAIVFARTSKSAARLSEQFKQGTVRKVYWAIVEGSVTGNQKTLTDWLVKNELRMRMQTAGESETGSKKAVLNYEVIQRDAEWTALRVELETGRKHQIRVQLAAASYPILGDRKYGAKQPFDSGIALHSRLLELDHPTTGERLHFVADPGSHWNRFGITAEV